MARGDFVDAGKSKLANRDAYSGFWWRYANTSQEAINTNSDIIEIYPYIWKSNSITDAYTNNLYNSYIQVSFGSTTYNQTLKTKYNFGNVSLNTNYGLTSAFNSSNPFGYSAPSSTTYITTTTKDGKTLYGARFTVQHNADGTSPSVTMKWHLEASSTHGNAEKTITVTLDTIPRASQPTCAGTTLGNSVTIYTNRPAGSGFTHTLNIKIGSTTIETFTGITDSKSWTPSIATYLSYIPSSSGTATIECITYSSGSEIGRATTSCVLTVPNNSDTKPTLTLTVSKGDNVVPDAWGVYVKGKSKLAISIVGSPKAGTSITSYYSTANGSSDTRSSYTTSELTGSGTVTANVKDGRGFTSNNATASYTVQDYTNPQITTSSVARCTSDGTLSDEGTYVKYSFAGSISPVSNKNAKTFKLRYKEKNGSYSDVATWSSAYTLNQTNIVFGSGNIDVTKEYVFRFEATDSFTTTAKEVEIGTVADLMNFNASGKSMAIGGVSQRGASESALDVMIPLYTKETIVGSIRSKNIFANYVVINGWIYDTGMRVNSVNGNRMAFIPCEANTTYTVSRSVITSSFRVGDYTSIPTMTSSNVDYTLPQSCIQDNSGTVITYTTSATAKYLIVHYANVGVDSASTITNSLNTIQVEQGSIATTYTPYQELNPDNYKNKEIIVGKISSKNMFNKNTALLNTGIDSSTGQTYVNNNVFVSDFIKIQKNTDYYISGGLTSVYGYDSSKTYLGAIVNTVGDKTFNTGNAEYIRVKNWWASDATEMLSQLNSSQLELGTEKTTYYPYQNLQDKTTVGEVRYNSTYLNTPIYNKLVRTGNIVHVYFIAKIGTAWTSNTDVITNLPANAIGNNFRFGTYIGSDEYLPSASGTLFFAWTQQDGTSIRMASQGITANKYLYISLTYITTD